MSGEAGAAVDLVLTPTLLLLHEGGWDEVLMVAAGLVVAYVVIAWTGRRSRDGDEEDDGEADARDEEPGGADHDDARSRPS